MRTPRRTLLTLAVVALLGTAVAVPADAAKSTTSGASRGKVYVTIFNSKTSPSTCLYKISGSNLKGSQSLWSSSSAHATSEDIYLLGYTDSNGNVISMAANLPLDHFSRDYRIQMFTDYYWPILDIWDQSAAINISDNCV